MTSPRRSERTLTNRTPDVHLDPDPPAASVLARRDRLTAARRPTWSDRTPIRTRPGPGSVLADAVRLPLADGACDAVFAAGIIHHLSPPDQGLVKLRRVTRRSARLAIFHPIGRAALAARRGSTLSDKDLLDRRNLEPLLGRHGWTLTSIDDGDDRYLAVAERT